MDYFPVFMDLRTRLCLVVGAGEAAARKASLLLRAGAHVSVVAPALTEPLSALLGNTSLRHEARCYRTSDLDGVVLAVAATGDRALDRAVSDDARARNLPVNVVDDPELCSVIVPALVDRSPILIAISTGGSAPVLARLLRGQIEALVPTRYGELAAFSAALRAKVQATLLDVPARRRFWEAVFEGDVAELFLRGELARAEAGVRALLAAHGGAGASRGEVFLIGAGPNDPELVSFRALRCLQRADVVLAAPDVSDAIVDLSRRDAARSRLPAWPVPEPSAVLQLLAAALAGGQRACVLARGDAFRQPDGCSLMIELQRSGWSCVVVPGVV